MPSTAGGVHSALNQRIAAVLRPFVTVEPGEVRAVCWSFLYFFCLLGGYYILRPVRDEMGILGGVRNLQWLFTGTFFAMLAAVPVFAWLAARFPRRTFVPMVYWFFIANILIFYVLFELEVVGLALARTFFIWTSVFNLFVVSVFWSFMADIYSSTQARRLFAFIAAGGSVGAIAGPGAAGLLAPALGPVNLLPVSAAVLAVALIAIHQLRHWDTHEGHVGELPDPARAGAGGTEGPVGGGVLTGVQRVFMSPYLLGICAFIVLYTTLATFLYFQQAHIVKDAFADSAQRTAVFAWIDFAVNALTIFGQVLLTHRLVGRFGIGVTLAVVPVIAIAGFAALAAAPVLVVLLAFQVLRRAGNYAVTRPTREMLFTILGREEKYKSKNFIDTVVYRGGDAVAGWIFAGLMALGLGLGAIAAVAVPISLLWLLLAIWLGRRYDIIRGTAPAIPAAPAETIRQQA
jgi:AAA family ATP:ADP antiporter